ncbi:hypothetical protein PFISCL1PPCAC_23468, partial [Pristionchus fissidentatus]
QELQWVKNDCTLIRNAVVLLEQEKDNLRQAVRKLKMENTHQREKMKKLQAEVKKLGGNAEETEEVEDMDYDDIGKNFILIGGAMDPLALRYEVAIRDDDGTEHKSAERYYWYKLADKFGDEEAKKRILTVANTHDAEEAMKGVKGFSETEWNKEKMEHWIRGQELKLEQVRWIACVLHETNDSYIAVAHQDKVLGTGWRKTREEASKPIFWDGENQGGKWMMKYRRETAAKIEYTGPQEKEDTVKKVQNLRKNAWRRVDQLQMGSYRGGMSGGGRGGYGGGQMHRGGGGGGYNNRGARGDSSIDWLAMSLLLAKAARPVSLLIEQVVFVAHVTSNPSSGSLPGSKTVLAHARKLPPSSGQSSGCQACRGRFLRVRSQLEQRQDLRSEQGPAEGRHAHVFPSPSSRSRLRGLSPHRPHWILGGHLRRCCLHLIQEARDLA